MRTHHTIFAAGLVMLCGVAQADLQDDLNSRWRGAWAVVDGDLYSNCSGSATNNRVSGDLIMGSGRRSFAPGELVRITRVDVRRRRVDVFLDVNENVLIEYQDGPFTLYNEASCEVELLFDFANERTRDVGFAGIDAQFNQWFERYARLADAEQSDKWNERERRPYPADYEQTLAEYHAWQIEEHNRLVDARINESIGKTGQLLTQVVAGDDFGAGLSHGIAAMRQAISDDCDRLVASGPGTFATSPDAAEENWTNGYKTGQELAYYVELGRLLQACYIVPDLS